MMKIRFAVVGLLALAVATVAVAQPPQPRFRLQPPQPAPPGRPADPALNPVPTDSFAFVSVKASKLWDTPAAKPLRDWVTAQKDAPLDAAFGVPFADLDRITLFFASADGLDRGDPVVLVTTRKPYNEARVLKALGVGKDEGRGLVGRVAEIRNGPFRMVALADDRTLLFLPGKLGDAAGPNLIAQLIVRKPDGPLAQALLDAQLHDFTLGLDIRGLGAIAHELNTDKRLLPYLSLLKAKTATLTGDFDKTAKLRLAMAFPDADTAKRAGPVLEDGMKFLAEVIGREKDSRETEAVIMAWAGSVLKNAKVTVDGSNVVATADVPYADEFAKFIAVLPKSLTNSRDELAAMGHLKQLGIGMHNIHDTMQRFPGDVLFGQKPPAMSWRVQILPYIEEDVLYKKLDMTKAWDDPANLKVLEAAVMPKIFEHPGRKAPKGHTYFRIFTMPKGAKGNERPLFKEGEPGPTLAAITSQDGASNTFMIVEAGEAVPWYKPDVLAYDGKLPLPQLGDKEANSFLVVFCDGSIRKFKPSKLDETTLRALITINGGEVIGDLDK